MIKVLFVCLGNICRSPLAEGILFQAIRKKGIDNQIHVDSCGTSAYHIGDQPDERTRRNARENKIELDHKARQFSAKDFERFDYILAMDASNYRNILRLDPSGEHIHKVSKLRDFDPEFPGEDVPDPYFGGEDGFQQVFEIVDRSVHEFLNHLENKHQFGSGSSGSTSTL